MEHYCGIVAVSGNTSILPVLESLQHRGYESAGISYVNSELNLLTYKNLGLVSDVFGAYEYPKDVLRSIGHVRYSTRVKTTVDNMLKETQPICSNNNLFSFAHNGNIPNIEYLNISSDSHSDSKVLVTYIEDLYDKYKTYEDALIKLMEKVPGAYSIVILTADYIYALRDRHGIRPLSIGVKDNNYMVISETCGLDNFSYLRDVQPGELIRIGNKLETIYIHQSPKPSFCSFELIYFMHPSSMYQDNLIEQIRYNLGYHMGKTEEIIPGAIVQAVPNSSIPSAHGFADATGLKFVEYMTKRANMKRTFILPTEQDRKKACDNKFIYDLNKLSDKIIYLIDDSIVRGTTMKSIIKKLRTTGAKEIHLRIISPVIKNPCFYGIDMSTKSELIGHSRTINQIKEELQADSLKYISTNDMIEVFGTDKVCTSCFTGEYDQELLDW